MKCCSINAVRYIHSVTNVPITYMPAYIQNIAHALPLFYIIEGLNEVMVYNSYGQAAVDLVVITVLSIGMIFAAIILFKW